MPWNHSKPQTSAPRERRRWRIHGKSPKKDPNQIPTQCQVEDIKSHVASSYCPLDRRSDRLTPTKVPRFSLKDGKHILAFIVDPRLREPRDARPTPAQEDHVNVPEPQTVEVPRTTPLDEPVGNLSKFQGLRSGFQHTEERERLTDALHSIFRTRGNLLHPDAQQDVAQCDFIYDVCMYKSDHTPLLRRMVVDFETEVCIIHDELYRALNIPIERYEGPPISVVGREGKATPLGKVRATWNMPKDENFYCAEFLVMHGVEFDVLLGTSTVRELGLYRRDPALASRLHAADQKKALERDC